MSKRKEKRAKIDVQNIELVELLELFKTSVVLKAMGLENNHKNRALLTDRRLVKGNFKADELDGINDFLLNISKSISLIY